MNYNKKTISNKVLENYTLSNFSYAIFDKCTFKGYMDKCNLTGAIFKNCTFDKNFEFKNCNLSLTMGLANKKTNCLELASLPVEVPAEKINRYSISESEYNKLTSTIKSAIDKFKEVI